MGKITHASIIPSDNKYKLTQSVYEADTTHLIGGTASIDIARTASYVIAASNSSALSKAGADYVCGDGIYTTDDQYIQAAIDALPTDGTYSYGKIVFSEGLFTLTAVVTIKGNVTLEGVITPYTGVDNGTRIHNGNTAGADAIRFHSSTTHHAVAHVRNMAITGNALSGRGLVLDEVNDSIVEGVVVRDHGSHGITVIACWGGVIRDCQINDNLGRNLAYVGDTGDSGAEICTMQTLEHTSFHSAYTDANVYVGACRKLVIKDCAMEYSGSSAKPFIIVANSSYNAVDIIHNLFGQVGSVTVNAIEINGGEVSIQNNWFSGGSTQYDIYLKNTNASTLIIKDNHYRTGPVCAVYTDAASTLYHTDIEAISAVLDLSTAGTDVFAYHALTNGQIVGYKILYTELSSADAGVSIDIGRYQSGVALDDDYFDTTTSEISKALGYSLVIPTSSLTVNKFVAGDTITVGTAGGKTGTGEVKVILYIAENVS